jgi:hypothetical protein
VIDLYQQPKLAKREQIIAAPTLIKKLPLPLRRFIGDMSDTEKLLIGIDLKPKNSENKSMNQSDKTRRQLLDELQALRSRMMEAEETLRAIRAVRWMLWSSQRRKEIGSLHYRVPSILTGSWSKQ